MIRNRIIRNSKARAHIIRYAASWLIYHLWMRCVPARRINSEPSMTMLPWVGYYGFHEGPWWHPFYRA